MTRMFEIYRCETCGNITKVIHRGPGMLVCCGKPMLLEAEKSEGQGKEKHLPVIEQGSAGIHVKVGALPHPMEDSHHIEWIEVRSGKEVYIHGLKPGDRPEADFPVTGEIGRIRAYCTVHGLWASTS